MICPENKQSGFVGFRHGIRMQTGQIHRSQSEKSGHVMLHCRTQIRISALLNADKAYRRPDLPQILGITALRVDNRHDVMIRIRVLQIVNSGAGRKIVCKIANIFRSRFSSHERFGFDSDIFCGDCDFFSASSQIICSDCISKRRTRADSY